MRRSLIVGFWTMSIAVGLASASETPPPRWPKASPREVGPVELRPGAKTPAVDYLEKWSPLGGLRWVVCRRAEDRDRDDWLIQVDKYWGNDSRGVGAVAFDLRSKAYRYLAPSAQSQDGDYVYRSEIERVAPWQDECCVVAVRSIARRHDARGALIEGARVRPEIELWQWSMKGEISFLGFAPLPVEHFESLLSLARVVGSEHRIDWQVNEFGQMKLFLADKQRKLWTVECRHGHVWEFAAVNDAAHSIVGIDSVHRSHGIHGFSMTGRNDLNWTILLADIDRQCGEVRLETIPGGQYPDSCVPLFGRVGSWPPTENVDDNERGLFYLDCLKKTISPAPTKPGQDDYFAPRSYVGSPDGDTLFDIRISRRAGQMLYIFNLDRRESKPSIALDPHRALAVLGVTAEGQLILHEERPGWGWPAESLGWYDELWLLDVPLGKTPPISICDGVAALGRSEKVPRQSHNGGGMF